MRILIIWFVLILAFVPPVNAAGLLIFEDRVLTESERRAAAAQLLNKARKYQGGFPSLSPEEKRNVEIELLNASDDGSNDLTGSTSYLIWTNQTTLDSLIASLSIIANGRYSSRSDEVKLWVASASDLLEISYKAFKDLRERGVVSGNADYFPWFSDAYAKQILAKVVPEID